jgi:hypothetical protein
MNDRAILDQRTVLERAQRFATELRARSLASEKDVGELERVLVQSRGERLDTGDDPLLVVMLCGPTAVGKSSLINALANAEISRRGIGAETSAPVLYIHERDDPSRLFEYSQALGQLGRDAASVVRHSRDELLHKVLIDTPDIDSVMRGHRELTEALVHCADVILFVTSAERYKTMQAADWVAQQRGQRAMAFVINKWDRASLGIDYDKRALVYGDFIKVLADIGFARPLVFKASALTPSSGGAGEGAENELRGLAAWLETGLSRSAAAAIADRRRRAAWGRLGAAIAPAIPQSLTGHPLAARAEELFASSQARAKQIIAAEALALSRAELDRGTRPATPGLLGSWTRFWDRLVTGAAALLSLLTMQRIRDALHATFAGEDGADASGAFGRQAATLLAQATTRIVHQSELYSVPLGPAVAAWADEREQLSEGLSSVVAETEGEVVAAQARPSIRRVLGTACLWAVEAALAAVLIATLYYLGTGFAQGKYQPGALLTNAFALLVALLLAGQAIGNLFFPPLLGRVRGAVAQRAGQMIDRTWQGARGELAAQLEAADRLAQEGKLLLTAIDAIVARLAPAIAADDGVSGLFAVVTEPEPPKAAPEPRPAPAPAPAVRRVAFE